MLLTRDDFDQRNRYLNIRNCIGALHELGVVPIVMRGVNILMK